MAVGKQVRDLEADLAICEAATQGPWMPEGRNVIQDIYDRDDFRRMLLKPCAPYMGMEHDIKFAAEARQGWPYAIRRTLEAEAEIDRLRNELDILQEQLRCRGCQG